MGSISTGLVGFVKVCLATWTSESDMSRQLRNKKEWGCRVGLEVGIGVGGMNSGEQRKFGWNRHVFCSKPGVWV